MAGLDFGALPPEVNSARMYAGPGSGPMRAAAMAWARLAAELAAAARAYESTISSLAGEGWLGPASEAMAAAAAPHAGWMSATAGQAEQAAVQAAAAASAFDQAYAATVPPPVIAANRSQLAALSATNTLGQHSAAIAALEAEYGRLWTQDAAAMYGYAGRAATATAVTPFTQPPPVANPAAQAAAPSTPSQLMQLLNAVPQTLNGLGSGGGSPMSLAGPLESVQGAADAPTASQVAAPVEALARSVLVANDANVSILYGQAQYGRNLNIRTDIAAAEIAAKAATKAVHPPAPAGAGGEVPAVSAGLGTAPTVGKLAVPPAWMEANPANPAARMAAALTGTDAGAAPAAGTTGLLADMAVAGLAGRAIAGARAPGRRAAVPDSRTESQLEHIAGELTGSREVQHWHTGSSRSESPFSELLKKPGVHTVHLRPGSPGNPDSPGGPPNPDQPPEAQQPGRG